MKCSSTLKGRVIEWLVRLALLGFAVLFFLGAVTQVDQNFGLAALLTFCSCWTFHFTFKGWRDE